MNLSHGLKNTENYKSNTSKKQCLGINLLKYFRLQGCVKQIALTINQILRTNNHLKWGQRG
jgi:hypothetical protein